MITCENSSFVCLSLSKIIDVFVVQKMIMDNITFKARVTRKLNVSSRLASQSSKSSTSPSAPYKSERVKAEHNKNIK